MGRLGSRLPSGVALRRTTGAVVATSSLLLAVVAASALVRDAEWRLMAVDRLTPADLACSSDEAICLHPAFMSVRSMAEEVESDVATRAVSLGFSSLDYEQTPSAYDSTTGGRIPIAIYAPEKEAIQVVFQEGLTYLLVDRCPQVRDDPAPAWALAGWLTTGDLDLMRAELQPYFPRQAQRMTPDSLVDRLGCRAGSA